MRLAALLALTLLLAGCVSTSLAEANRESVKALADVAVAEDESAAPLASDAMATAEQIVAATGTFAQMTNLGVPTALTDRNYANVELLTSRVAGNTEPATVAAVTRAAANAAELSGKANTSRSIVSAVKTTPVGNTITEILAILGAAGTSIYGATRGRKHITRWWNEPGKKSVEAPPNADGAA